LAMLTATAEFAGSTVGTWQVAINDGYVVTGNDEDNYTLDFAEVEARIKYNVQVVNPGWNLVVLQLTEMTPESLLAWNELGAMILQNHSYQKQRGVSGETGQTYWLFNRKNEPVELQGLRQFPLTGWDVPENKLTWTLAGPERANFVIPSGMIAWQWENGSFILLKPGETLPAGKAAWFWQY